jgi:hypothetical protein
VVLALVACVALPAPALATTIIVDNANNAPGNTFSSTGTWSASTVTTGGLFYGTNFLTHTGNQGPATATYTPSLPLSGDYEVYVRWTQAPTRGTAVPFTVNYDGGAFNYFANQTTNGGTWLLVGVFPFVAGTAGFVDLVAATGSLTTTSADAVMFTLVPEPSSLSLIAFAGTAGLAMRRRRSVGPVRDRP